MRMFRGRIRFWTALVVVLYWTCLHLSPAAAGLAASRTSGETGIASARDADLVVVQRALEHRVVAQKLRDYGVRPDDVKLKLASMSDQDLHRLASASKGLPSGGDGVGLLIGILVVILLVIIILKLLHKDVIVR